jgi:hypothetical protein
MLAQLFSLNRKAREVSVAWSYPWVPWNMLIEQALLNTEQTTARKETTAFIYLAKPSIPKHGYSSANI